MLKNSTLTFRG